MTYGFRATLFIISISLISCTKLVNNSGNDLGSRISPTVVGPNEADYCATPISYGGTNITVSGVAEFQAREIFGTESTASGLGAAGAAKKIRRAEVRVTNSAGAVAQCATTDNNGAFSLVLPVNSGTYTVSVNSRAYNDYLKASVLDAPERKNFYSLSQTVDSSAGDTNLTFLATVDGAILGGAFNILDQLLDANEYLKAQAGTSACTFTGCVPFPATAAPKVEAYWEKGFNPNAYFGDSQGLSFYLPGYDRLFISGGNDGDTDTADTDHFDNSIILHEYGHFIEDELTISDSPGGYHDGLAAIDPRLAWSEAWGNFLQAAVRNDPHYIDTYGNSDGTTDTYFFLNLEDASVSGLDVPTQVGEGNFREFSITRLLWDAIDDTPSETLYGGTDTTKEKFAEIWAAITSPQGLKNPLTNFRDVGLLHQAQATYIGAASDWTDIRTIERHVTEGYDSGLATNTERFRRKYALYVDDTPSCSHSFVMTPVLESAPNSFSGSNLVTNNDFLFYKHPGGALALTLSYVTTSGTKQVDLDLFLYKEAGRFGYGSDLAGYSNDSPTTTIGATQTESITLSNLAAGDYLIDVKAWAGSSAADGVSTATYHLEISGGAQLCPAPQP